LKKSTAVATVQGENGKGRERQYTRVRTEFGMNGGLLVGWGRTLRDAMTGRPTKEEKEDRAQCWAQDRHSRKEKREEPKRQKKN